MARAQRAASTRLEASESRARLQARQQPQQAAGFQAAAMRWGIRRRRGRPCRAYQAGPGPSIARLGPPARAGPRGAWLGQHRAKRGCRGRLIRQCRDGRSARGVGAGIGVRVGAAIGRGADREILSAAARRREAWPEAALRVWGSRRTRSSQRPQSSLRSSSFPAAGPRAEASSGSGPQARRAPPDWQHPRQGRRWGGSELCPRRRPRGIVRIFAGGGMNGRWGIRELGRDGGRRRGVRKSVGARVRKCGGTAVLEVFGDDV